MLDYIRIDGKLFGVVRSPDHQQTVVALVRAVTMGQEKAYVVAFSGVDLVELDHAVL